MDIDARIQLFDLKTTYQFQTVPGVDQYNMPLYDQQIQPGGQTIAPFPVYQGFMDTCYANGIQIPFYNQKDAFWNIWPSFLQSLAPAAIGDGGSTYQLILPFFPAIPGHIDIAGIIATGTNQDPPYVTNLLTSVPQTSIYSSVYFNTTGPDGTNVIAADSGQFLQSDINYGLLFRPGNAPFGYVPLSGGYSTTVNTINYQTGVANVTFTGADGAPVNIPAGNQINSQCYFYQQGLPRAVLMYNNCITIRPPPDIQYLIQLTAYLTPAAFLASGQAVPFGYMTEYISRGATRKILADTGDIEQFNFYEPFFKEQETLVWKRSQRQFTATRTGTIFSELQGQSGYNNIGQGQ
jgi:hypothetical protein